jgi:leukotriene-A4 hydrolase
VDLDAWLHGEGTPADAPDFHSERLDELTELATGWTPERCPSAKQWSTTETMFFLSQLSPQDGPGTEALGAWLNLRSTGNGELQCAWLARAAEAGIAGIEPELRDFINQVGRTKLLKPVVEAMAKISALRPLAQELVAANRSRWHGSTRMALDATLE